MCSIRHRQAARAYGIETLVSRASPTPYSTTVGFTSYCEFSRFASPSSVISTDAVRFCCMCESRTSTWKFHRPPAPHARLLPA